MTNPKKAALSELLKFLGSPFNFLIISGTVILTLLLFVFSLISGSNSLVYNEGFLASQPQVGTNLKPKVSSFSLSQLFLPNKVLAASINLTGNSNCFLSTRFGLIPMINLSWDRVATGAQVLRMDGSDFQAVNGTSASYPLLGQDGRMHTWQIISYNVSGGIVDSSNVINVQTATCATPTPTPTPTSRPPTPPPPTPTPTPTSRPPTPTPTITPTPSPPTPTPKQIDLNIVAFKLSKNTFSPGENMQAVFTVANTGQVQVSSQVALYKYSSSQPSCNQALGKVADYNLNLLPDQSVSFDPVTSAPTTVGNYTAWVFVDWNCGINETSEQNNWASIPYVVSQTPNCYAYVEGLKFNDRNGNGQKDANDEGLPGFNFSLVKDGAVIVNTASGNDGRFSFGLQPCGTYTITETPRSNWQPTTPTSVTYNFGNATVLFGNKIVPPPLTACDDVNGDGAVSLSDVLAVLGHMSSSASYDSRYDVNKDQKVDITDVYLVLVEVGRICRTASIPDPNFAQPQFQCQNGLVIATLAWYPPSSNVAVSSYTIQISTSSNFGDSTTTQTYTLPGTITSHTVYPLMPQTRYYWRVIARTADGRQSSGANISQFLTIPCSTQATPIPPFPTIFPSLPPVSLQTTPSLPSLPQLPTGEGTSSLPTYNYPQLPPPPQQYTSDQYPTLGGTSQMPGVPPSPPTANFPGLLTYDSYPPNVQILAPQEKTKVPGEVEIQISATDNVGVSSVDIYINDQLRATLTKPPYTWIWNVDQEPEIKNANIPLYCHFLFGLCRTSFIISVKASDAAGHVSADSVLVYRSQ